MFLATGRSPREPRWINSFRGFSTLTPPLYPPSERTKRLGRGLDALLGATPSVTGINHVVTDIAIDRIEPNPFQPRRDFDASGLEELQASMRSSGLLQPIVVRSVGASFQVIAGERRLRAARSLGWNAIPAIVRTFDQQQMLTLALVENLQRVDLNPIEEADGYHRLQQEFSLTQQQIASLVGKDRSTVANLLRLRQLPDAVRNLVRSGRLSIGHARALLALPAETDLVAVAEMVVAQALTVRDVEQLGRPASPLSRVNPVSDAPENRPASAPEVKQMADRLRRFLQTDVAITCNPDTSGELRIRFYSAEDLERLLGLVFGHTSHEQ